MSQQAGQIQGQGVGSQQQQPPRGHKFSKTVTGAANNGSGLIRITTSATSHNLNTGDHVTISGIVGTTEANAGWTITVITANTFDLVGSTFTNAYISGGTVSRP